MPRLLIDRCRDDSIREFRSAARHRFDDALALAAAGQRTGAIYLWGYVAEMTLKAAYFSAIGVADTATIDWRRDLLPAVNRGRQMGIAWPSKGQGHNVHAWAELLVSQRATSLATAYPIPFGLEVQAHGQRFEKLWRDTLRYRNNLAYPHEVRSVQDSAGWFLMNSHVL